MSAQKNSAISCVKTAALPERYIVECYYYQVNVDTFQVGDFWKSSISTGDESGHGKHGGDAESYARRSRVTMKPERDPGQHNDQARRHIDLNDVVAQTSHEVKLASQSRVIACTISHARSVNKQTFSRLIQQVSLMNSSSPLITNR